MSPRRSDREEAEETYGWTVEHTTNASGKPRVIFTKADRNEVTVDRAEATPAEVALQRGMVTALEQDVGASSPDDRGLWEQRLEQALTERDDAAAQRVALAGVQREREARQLAEKES